MSKVHHFYITKELKEMLGTPIRKKNDIFKILLEISSFLIINEKPVDRGFGEFIVKVDKMSRVFIHLVDQGQEVKHYSFNFPFIITEESLDEQVQAITLVSKNNRIKIDSISLAVLKGLSSIGWFSEDGEMSSSCMLDHYEALEIVLKDLVESPGIYIDEIWLLIKELILLEPGYLRYDFDQKHANGRLHPLHHLDINYTNHISFKIGLESGYLKEHFIDLLDLRTDCRYLS
ncbi:hypothetical protein [Paenibacillus lautus]|uniref:hypothetical protein n=1 Tax=Paenibacillus lautus TaxID=1401 RepID=UPI001C114DAD|nr:hypothetical protein [Paenibacillus lautus]MBU5349142.1 hypothetical protein [Paenibacillus lautus]